MNHTDQVRRMEYSYFVLIDPLFRTNRKKFQRASDSRSLSQARIKIAQTYLERERAPQNCYARCVRRLATKPSSASPAMNIAYVSGSGISAALSKVMLSM